MHDEMNSLYWAVRAELAPRPSPGGRHRWTGAPQAVLTGARRRHAIDNPTEEMDLMGRHADDEAGRADDWHVCEGENRADPDSWDDPQIADAWAEPEDIPCG